MQLQPLTHHPIDYALWEVTSNCNLNCVHCRAAASPDILHENIIDGEEAKKLLRSLANLKTKTLVFTGGEPLLRKDLEDLIQYATSLGIRCRVQSNSLLLTKERINKLKKAGIISFGVGLDSYDPECHDKIRNCKGAFNKAVDSIKMIKEAGVPCHVEFTLTKWNLDSLPKVFELLDNLKVDTFLTRSAIFSGRATTNKPEFMLTSEEYRQALSTLFELSKKYKNIKASSQDSLYNTLNADFKSYIADVKKSTQKQVICGCTIGVNMVHIRSTGDVGVCTFLPDILLGNIKETPLEDIWEQRFSKSESLCDSLTRKLKGKCKSCKYLNFCGGCRARALGVYGDMLKDDPYCWNCAV